MTRRAVFSFAWSLVFASLATAQSARPATRPTIGVAFGGGSARGLAHIGVIQWFEEHHIPIDTAAGTSMGGLIGGAFAAGMSAAELRAFVNGIDWDVMFGSSTFPFKNLRRKQDARSYPSRLEFGAKRGVVPPSALNDGRQVDLLLARVAAPYYALRRFDDLPTPFRVVAVDLRAGEKVVLDSGSLATALRATMSLPGVFPPVERDGRVLVDGGALDNVPADVVRGAGATVVIAIDVGYAPATSVDYSMFGLFSSTIDAMMRSATRAALASADVTIPVDVEGIGSLDWRRADEIIARGHQAAQRRAAELLRYRVSDAEWETWLAERARRRRTAVPAPAFLVTDGIRPADAAIVRRALEPHLNQPLDVPALERDLTALSGLDRYQSITWQEVENGGRTGLLIKAHEKPYGPPFLMLGVNVENVTSEDYRVNLAARYLAYDRVGAGSELRLDGTLGADPGVAAEVYGPIRASDLFVRAAAGARAQTFNVAQGGAVVAEYRERRLFAQGDLGVNLRKDSELSGGVGVTRLNDVVRTGDPGLPDRSGVEVQGRLRWLLDTQDSPVVPSTGTRAIATLSHTFAAPQAAGFARTNRGLTQAELRASSFFSPSARNRLFVVLSGGTSFGDHPLATEQFTLGYPFVLDAFPVGEHLGDHYAVLTLGGARRIARLPDFVGGPIFAGAWLENGAAFNSHEPVDINTHVAGGIVLDTLVGPALVAASAGLDGGWRILFAVGRIFR